MEGEGTFSSLQHPLSTYDEYFHLKLTNWTIEEGITKIQHMMDCSCLYIESIQLPESLQIIDEYAFFSCARLKSIVIPQGVKIIHKNAFKYCNRLKTVTNLSDQTVYLPNHPSFETLPGTIYDYYVDGKAAVTVPPGKTAVGVARKYIVALESDGGTLNNYNENRNIYFQVGDPPKTSKSKEKRLCILWLDSKITF